MNLTINLPFAQIHLKNANNSHKSYFDIMFFPVHYSYPVPKYVINVNFKKLKLPNKLTYYLEEDISATEGDIYIYDTKKNKLKMKISEFNNDEVNLFVEPEFDLYYLYNYIIEPLLIIMAAAKGVLYVHSSALAKKDGGYVFPAWRHTGKTSSIFNMAKEDIKFMGDDFSILFDSKLYLYPKYINIFSYNFESYPWLYDNLSSLLSLRIKFSVYLKKFLYSISQKLSGSLSKVFFRLSELAEISTNTKVTPEQIGLAVEPEASFKKAIFIVKANTENKKPIKLTQKEIKQKLLMTTVHEIKDFLDIYQKYKFLYSESNNKLIESFEENYLKAINKNLKTAYESYIVNLPHNDAYLKKV